MKSISNGIILMFIKDDYKMKLDLLHARVGWTVTVHLVLYGLCHWVCGFEGQYAHDHNMLLRHTVMKDPYILSEILVRHTVIEKGTLQVHPCSGSLAIMLNGQVSMGSIFIGWFMQPSCASLPINKSLINNWLSNFQYLITIL